MKEKEIGIDNKFIYILKNKFRIERSFAWQENFISFLFLLPSLSLFAIFLFYPLVKSLYLSLFLTDPQGKVKEFVGLDNFVGLLFSSSFYQSLLVTFKFALLTVPVGLILALILAYLTNLKWRGMRFFQLIFSLPLSLSVGTASIIWLLLFHPSMGMFNYFLSKLGLTPIFWLSDPKFALISISLMTIWLNLGFSYIVLLSGLQAIPDEIYESAQLDGSGIWTTFSKIITPLLSPNLFFLFIVSTINSLQAFGQIHLMTQGGPTDTTNVLVYALYREAFINYRFGTGSAQALILFLIVLILTMVQFKFLDKKVHYQ